MLQLKLHIVMYVETVLNPVWHSVYCALFTQCVLNNGLRFHCSAMQCVQLALLTEHLDA